MYEPDEKRQIIGNGSQKWECWEYEDDEGGEGTLCGWRGFSSYPALYLSNWDYLKLELQCPGGGGGSFGRDAEVDRGWQHVIVSNDANGSILYIDGQEKGRAGACRDVGAEQSLYVRTKQLPFRRRQPSRRVRE